MMVMGYLETHQESFLRKFVHKLTSSCLVNYIIMSMYLHHYCSTL